MKPRVVPNGSEVWSHADKRSVVVAGWALLRCFLEVVEYPFVIVDSHVKAAFRRVMASDMEMRWNRRIRS